MFANQYGLRGILKKGTQYLANDEVQNPNLHACDQLASRFYTCMGPQGMKKILVNHIEKLYVTSDVATLADQYEIVQPAANMIKQAIKMQDQEYADGTNFVMVFCGALLRYADQLLKQGYHAADIVKGYQVACNESTKKLEELASFQVHNPRDATVLTEAILATVASKSLGHERVVADLVVKAVLSALPPNPKHLNLDNLRVAKILGGDIKESTVIPGMVILRDVSSVANVKTNCKVLVFGCGLELSSTETKGTVLIHNAAELLQFSKGEEEEMNSIIKSISEAGVQAIVVGGNISDLAQHYCNKYDILTLKVQSKFDLRRICRALNATALIQLRAPTPEEAGFVEKIAVEEIASNKVTVIRSKDSRISTVLLRGATSNFLDEIERAVCDGVRCIKNITEDSRFVPGGGAAEVELSLHLQSYAATISSMEQGAILKFAQALHKIPTILANNAGLSGKEVLTHLIAAHNQSKPSVGVDITGSTTTGVLDILNDPADYPVLDHMLTRKTALKVSVDTVVTILLIAGLYRARPAGGPKPPQQSGHWDED